MNKKTIYDIPVNGKKVYVRVDYNVPHDEQGNILDDRRIRSTLPTINYLLEHGAAVILASHMGRPKGQVKPDLSLKPVAARLSELLGREVKFAPSCVGEETRQMKKALKPGEVLLLENLRFEKGEEKNDEDFARELAEGCDVAVNDAFGSSHRSHASIVGVGNILPMVSGLLMKKEIDFLGGVIDHPVRPFAAIIGGAKISDKIHVIANLMEKADVILIGGGEIDFLGGVIDHPVRPFAAIIGGAKISDKIHVIANLMEKADVILIGGGMANTFVAAEGYDMGKSLQDRDRFDLANELRERAKKLGSHIMLPVDFMAGDSFSERVSPSRTETDLIWLMNCVNGLRSSGPTLCFR